MAEKQRQYLLLAIALLFGILAIFNFLYLGPLMDDKTSYQVKLAQLEKQVQTLQQNTEQFAPVVPEEILSNIVETLPVKPYTDQLVKDLEKLQTISRVQIDSVTFAQTKNQNTKEIVEKFYPKGDSSAEDLIAQYMENAKTPRKPLNLAVKVMQSNGESDVKEEDKREKETVDPSLKQVKMMTLEQLKKAVPDATLSTTEINMALKGEYEDIYKFVTELQSLSRYLRVDELTFTSPEKEEYTIPKDTKLTATIKLTSYYVPQFDKIVDKLPPVQVEGPSGKWNPLKYEITTKEESSSEPSN
jgi:Tfp pilus assembly protein PilO